MLDGKVIEDLFYFLFSSGWSNDWTELDEIFFRKLKGHRGVT